MFQNEKNTNTNNPPPYSELNIPRGQNILDQLTLSRAQHIQSVIDTHILPLVEQQASYGIAHTVIALLPSDIPLPPLKEKSEFSFESTNPTEPTEIIGFPSEEQPKVVRLEGRINRTEFWRPQAIIVELERVLRESLNASPRLRSPDSPTRSMAMRRDFQHPVVEQREGQSAKRSFFGKMGSRLGGPSKNGEDIGEKQMQATGLVLVTVRLEEVCLRTVNDFGLYDTLSRQCVIIRVDARC